MNKLLQIVNYKKSTMKLYLHIKDDASFTPLHLSHLNADYVTISYYLHLLLEKYNFLEYLYIFSIFQPYRY